MAVSLRGFYIELYEEYLEEASFLYEQRLGLFDDPEITWKDIGEFEERFEAHIDGLVVGGDLALEICQRQAQEGDFGELHAAVRVFCRQDRKDLVLAVCEGLDYADEERTRAVTDALKHELPAEWLSEFSWLLREGAKAMLAILVTVFGYRRLNAGTELLMALERTEGESLSAVLWALGRLGERRAVAPLRTLLHSDGAETCLAAALALLRFHDREAVHQCERYGRTDAWPCMALALGGGHSAAESLLRVGRGAEVAADALIALGLFGDLVAMESLLADLTNADLAEAAAMALDLLTGARLYEEVFIPDEIEEDELFEEELERFRKGDVPMRPDGQPFGTTLRRLSQNPDEWQRWWAGNRTRFDPRVRYRNGRPYSPAVLLEGLESEQTPHRVRQLTYEELVIRYGMDVAFEADMTVREQEGALIQMRRWIQENARRFQPGAWYFAGQLLAG